MSWLPRSVLILVATTVLGLSADPAIAGAVTAAQHSATGKAKPKNAAKAPVACTARVKTHTVIVHTKVRTHVKATRKHPAHWVTTNRTVRRTVVGCVTKTSSKTVVTKAPPTTTITKTSTLTSAAAPAPTSATAPAPTSATAPAPTSTSAPVTGGPVPAGPLTIGINANTQGWGANAGTLQDKVAQTGVRWLREELDWDTIETAPGQDNWTHYDQLYSAAAQRGMTVLPVIMSTPSWDAADPMTIPSDPTAYANFVAQVVDRYGPGGAFWNAHPELAPVPSSWFELWNEPYWTSFSTGGPDAAKYARLVAAAGAAAHAANPAAKILIASDITGQTVNGHFESWTDQMYDAVPTLNQDFDAVAVHPYGATLTATTDDAYGRFRNVMEQVRADFVANGASNKPFWLTEIGWSTCPGQTSPYCYSVAQQAANYSQLFQLLHTTYASYVRAVFVYHYNDFAGSAGSDEEGHFGLTRADGSPKPAYAVFQAAIANNNS